MQSFDCFRLRVRRQTVRSLSGRKSLREVGAGNGGGAVLGEDHGVCTGRGHFGRGRTVGPSLCTFSMRFDKDG